MGNAFTALSFGIALEQLAYLEEEHHKDRLRKFGFRPRQEPDTERTDGGYRHQKMLVESLTFRQALDGFLQCVVTNQEVGNEVDHEQLPLGQVQSLFDSNRHDEQYDGDTNEPELLAQRMLVMVLMFMFMLMLAALVLMILV